MVALINNEGINKMFENIVLSNVSSILMQSDFVKCVDITSSLTCRAPNTSRHMSFRTAENLHTSFEVSDTLVINEYIIVILSQCRELEIQSNEMT